MLARIGSEAPQPALHAAVPGAASYAKAKDPVRAMKQLERASETAFILDPTTRPELPPASGWRARYYETLDKVHQNCWSQGHRFLTKLGLGVGMPAQTERANLDRQKGVDCGYWVLHYIEIESRRKRGEGRFVLRYNLDYRTQQVVTMVRKLKPGEAAAKAKAKAGAKAASKAPEITGS